jgi:hypothetical protein
MSGTQSQKSLGSFKLRTLFQESVAEETRELEEPGTASVLRHMSLAVHELQEAGLDIHIDIRSGDYSSAYDMAFGTAEENASVPVYGFLHIGPMARLFAIASKLDDAPVAKLWLSEHNTNESQGRAEWANSQSTPSVTFHFDEDPDALKDFQKYVVKQAALYTAAMKHDVAGVFNNPGRAPEKLDKKPSLGSALRKPQT